jgi:peptide chain release factor 1
MHLPQAKLDSVLDRFHQVEARMSAATEGPEIVRLSKEHAELKPVADAVEALVRARNEAPELDEMARSGDPEMASLAREELQALNARLPELEREVALLLAPKDKDENASVILEVRAGTGRRRGGAVRGRPVPHVQPLRPAPGLAG